MLNSNTGSQAVITLHLSIWRISLKRLAELSRYTHDSISPYYDIDSKSFYIHGRQKLINVVMFGFNTVHVYSSSFLKCYRF